MVMILICIALYLRLFLEVYKEFKLVKPQSKNDFSVIGIDDNLVKAINDYRVTL